MTCSVRGGWRRGGVPGREPAPSRSSFRVDYAVPPSVRRRRVTATSAAPIPSRDIATSPSRLVSEPVKGVGGVGPGRLHIGDRGDDDGVRRAYSATEDVLTLGGGSLVTGLITDHEVLRQRDRLPGLEDRDVPDVTKDVVVDADVVQRGVTVFVTT